MTAIAPPVAARRTARARADRRKQGWVRRTPLLPALVFTIIVTQLPFLLTLYYSLQSWSLVRPGSQHFVGFANYVDVFQDSQFRTTALNTVIMTVGVVLIAMVLGVALALLLDRKFLGRGVVRTLLITPFLVMPVAGALVWKTVMLDPTFGIVNFILRPFGIGHFNWIGSLPLGSVMIEMIWQWTPFMMLLVLAGLQSQPTDILEAASTDGARPRQIFRELTLPHLRRYIELGIVLGAIYVVNEFDAIYMMTQGGPGIGSPQMNRFDATVDGDGIRIGDALLPASDAQRQAIQGHGKLIAGIRPEHLSLGDGPLTMEVSLVEDLGSDSYVYGHLAGDNESSMIVRSGRVHPRPGEAVKVAVDTDQLHLFDAARGLRLGD